MEIYEKIILIVCMVGLVGLIGYFYRDTKCMIEEYNILTFEREKIVKEYQKILKENHV